MKIGVRLGDRAVEAVFPAAMQTAADENAKRLLAVRAALLPIDTDAAGAEPPPAAERSSQELSMEVRWRSFGQKGPEVIFENHGPRILVILRRTALRDSPARRRGVRPIDHRRQRRRGG